MKFLQQRSIQSSAWLGVLLVAAGMCFPAAAMAASAIAQGFQPSGSDIVSGALVSLRPGTPNTVELTTVSNRAHMVGIAGKQSLIEFSNGKPIQAVTSGATPALVSDINGAVKSGDKITASPIIGVGMKATESATVVGSSQADMQISTTETREIVAANGKQRTVHIGAVPLLVTPSYYEANINQSKLVPSAVQDFAATLAGHQVSAVRILIAGLLVVMLFVVVAMLLHSSVRASIISIGRNPLSRNSVHRSLLEVGITVVGVLAFTVIAVYLILTT